MCIQAPTLRSTKRTQFGFHSSNAFALRAFSMFWVSWRTTFALYRKRLCSHSSFGSRNSCQPWAGQFFTCRPPVPTPRCGSGSSTPQALSLVQCSG